MRLCLIGKTGQLATALLQSLPGDAPPPLVLARPDFDLADTTSLVRRLTAEKPSIVINAAAYTAVDAAESDRETAFAINAAAPAALAQACEAMGSILIHLSTDYVFDGRSALPYRENDTPNPLNVYGATKLAGEEAIRSVLKRHVILRTSWIYAVQGRNFVQAMLALAAKGEMDIPVICDQTGAPTYAADLARAVLEVARQVDGTAEGERRFGTFHLANTGDTSWAGFAEAIMDLRRRAGHHAPSIRWITSADRSSPAQRPLSSRLDCRAIAEAYGLRLPHWHDGLNRCLSAPPHAGRNAMAGECTS